MPRSRKVLLEGNGPIHVAELFRVGTHTVHGFVVPADVVLHAIRKPSLSRGKRGHSHRVHFTEEADNFTDNSEILIQKLDDRRLAIHLGFLKLLHRYEVCFKVPHGLGDVRQKFQELPNKNVKLLEIVTSPVDRECELKIELFAFKEKLLKEAIILQDCSNESNTCTITLHARVLGKGKGTPFLKSGIRCIGFELDEESEASDWQGFD